MALVSLLVVFGFLCVCKNAKCDICFGNNELRGIWGNVAERGGYAVFVEMKKVLIMKSVSIVS